ncbi:MAG: SDR family oxidoreductase [Polyangiaceae bacterium]
MNTTLEEKIAVVTGVTSGIGEAIAARLLRSGSRVVGVARSAEKLDALRKSWGERFEPRTVDLADVETRARAIEALAKDHPRVDVVVNNAAECLYDAPLDTPIETYRRLLEVNVLSGIELVQNLVPRMPAGGHVVQLSSVTARHLPAAKFAPYAMSKALSERFVEALRLELHPRQIKVSLVVPGLVATPIYDKVEGFEATRAKLSEHVKKWLDADDVAEAVLWMLTRPAHVAVSEVVIMPREQAR